MIDALGAQAISGKVVQIVPAADPCQPELHREDRVAGESARFARASSAARNFRAGERQSICVPQTALVHRGQLEAVYVVDKDQVASLRYITLGKPSAKDVEVLSGLDSGERVVAEPAARILSGKRIGAQ